MSLTTPEPCPKLRALVYAPRMIGGQDVVLETKLTVGEAMARAVVAILKVWPGGVMEDANTSELLRVADLGKPDRTEVLVYRNYAARGSWTQDGWTKGNCRSMVYVISLNGELTCVVEPGDDPEMNRILDGVREALKGQGECPPEAKAS
jgi:hypothetical protein